MALDLPQLINHERNHDEPILHLRHTHATAMSLEDDMTVLDCIEQHPDFPDHIAHEARQQAKEIISNAKETL